MRRFAISSFDDCPTPDAMHPIVNLLQPTDILSVLTVARLLFHTIPYIISEPRQNYSKMLFIWLTGI